jgi:hypothetical protein
MMSSEENVDYHAGVQTGLGCDYPELRCVWFCVLGPTPGFLFNPRNVVTPALIVTVKITKSE